MLKNYLKTFYNEHVFIILYVKNKFKIRKNIATIKT